MSISLFQILNISRQDMASRLTDLDVVANNLANVNTSGYKSNRTNFQELLDGGELSGSHLSSTQLLNTPGAVKTTGNPLDLSINGNGFFSVSLPGGKVGYTRDGEFRLDASGKIVTAEGNPLVWQGQLPAGATEVQIQADGGVYTFNGSTWTQVGAVQLSRFPNDSGLQSAGGNILLETAASGKAQSFAPGSANTGILIPESIEQSNVDLANEMASLSSLQSSFQISMQAFQQTDQMIQETIHMRKA